MELFDDFKKLKQRDARRTLFNRSRHLLTEEGNNLQNRVARHLLNKALSMDHVKKHKVKQNIVRRFTVFDNVNRSNSHEANNASGRERPYDFGCARDLMSLMMIKD